MFQIRYYQEEAVHALYNYFANKTGNPIIALPTGTGKSVVIAEFIRSVFTYYPGQRILMLTHVRELIAQNYAELIGLWPLAPAGIYSAGLKRKEIRPITFGGIASVVKRAVEFGHIDIVSIDECHLVSPHDETSYQNFIADLRITNPRIKIIGFTATPYRLGQGLLTNPIETKKGQRPSLFTDICYDMTGLSAFNKLIEEGFLCKLIPKRTKETLDVSNVGTVAGEYNLDELQKAVDREEITRRAIDETIQTAAEMPHSNGNSRCRWLVFATGIAHTDNIAREFAGRGFSVRAVHSKTPDSVRDATVRWFKQETDDLRIIANNGVFTVGFNCPQLDLIVSLRPTNSPGLWVQKLGRGTRMYEGKDNCLVLDFAGNTRRLGPINDPIIPKRKGQKGSGEAPVKVCEHCGTYNHASVRFCVNCNKEFPRIVKIKATASEAELVKSDSPQVAVFPVERVTYDVYTPNDSSKPKSLKVVYYSGHRAFSEWVCMAHSGIVGEKARNWWRRCTIHTEAKPTPKTAEEAKARVESLRWPTHIRVWTNLRHPRVMDLDFTGRGFVSQLEQEKQNKSSLPQKLAMQQPAAT